MTINGKVVKEIRPMTVDEIIDWMDNLKLDSIIYCIVYEDGTIQYPKWACIECMKNDKCLFNNLN